MLSAGHSVVVLAVVVAAAVALVVAVVAQPRDVQVVAVAPRPIVCSSVGHQLD